MNLSPQKLNLTEIFNGPLLPLRDIVVFPHMVVPLFVGRKKSILALEESMRRDKKILLCTQKDSNVNDPTANDIYQMGTVGVIVQMLKLPDFTVKVLVEGKSRAGIVSYQETDDYFCVDYQLLEEENEETVETSVMVRELKSSFEAYVNLNKQIPPEVLSMISTIDDPSRLCDAIVVHLTSLKIETRQELLENISAASRMDRVYELVQSEIEILQVERRIRTRVRKQMERTQKEYYLNEQMQAIQKELGEKDEFRSELVELENKIRNKPAISKEAQERGKKELKKLQMMSPMSAEATVIRNYLDWVTALPWGKKTKEKNNLKKSEDVLNEDHFGLEKIKERIVEHLAVEVLSKKLTGPILCFVGPPGTGKTSLARSVARATGRQFIRLSLGGVRDEAEIRGHRRTYIGAMPGKIIQSLKKAGTDNPVFLLDEIDKMSSDFRGDPASAMLEVLDPEQNKFFNDHYMDLDYDLSDVMFITTANTLSGIPVPLRDRMEIIELSSYTEFEKLSIAQNYLVSRQKEKCGMASEDVSFSDEAIEFIIHRYTKEAGVRNLEREISSVIRKIATKIVKEELKGPFNIEPKDVSKYLGVEKYKINNRESHSQIGLANGLAVTSVGGDLLPVEVCVVAGKGKLIRTGRMGEVMQEASEAALTYVRSRCAVLEIGESFLKENDIHIHFPEGGVPKDGPSAGITTATCIISALTKIPVRMDLAMTGEITLRGRVLPIGGVKEKLIAAHRGGVSRVIIPAENYKDLHDVPKQVISQLEVILVNHMDEVLAFALESDDIRHRFEINNTLKYEKGHLVTVKNKGTETIVQ